MINNVISSIGFIVVAFMVSGRPSVLDIDQVNNPVTLMLGLSSTIGVAHGVQAVPRLRREAPEIRFHPAFRHPAVKKLVRLSGWICRLRHRQPDRFIVVLDRRFDRSRSADGVPTGDDLLQLPHGLFAVSIMTTNLTEYRGRRRPRQQQAADEPRSSSKASASSSW